LLLPLVLSTLRNRIRIAGQRSCRISPSSSSCPASTNPKQSIPGRGAHASHAHLPASFFEQLSPGIVFAKTRARLAHKAPSLEPRASFYHWGRRSMCVSHTNSPKVLVFLFFFVVARGHFFSRRWHRVRATGAGGLTGSCPFCEHIGGGAAERGARGAAVSWDTVRRSE